MPDERGQEGAVDVDAEVGEDLQPGFDAGAHGIHEGAVEVEEDGAAAGAEAWGVVMSVSMGMSIAYRAEAVSCSASATGSVTGC